MIRIMSVSVLALLMILGLAASPVSNAHACMIAPVISLAEYTSAWKTSDERSELSHPQGVQISIPAVFAVHDGSFSFSPPGSIYRGAKRRPLNSTERQ